MHAYLIFGSENDHPLAWLLNKRHRHVWCIVADLEHQTWVSYDWGQGLPELRTEAALDYDVKGHYESHGYDVVVIPEGAREAVQGPLVLNNCVGHVKSVMGIRGFSFFPHQLYRQVTRQRKREAEITRRLNMVAAPGFGGGSGPPPIKWFVDPITRKFAPPDVIDPAQIFGEKEKEAAKARKLQMEQRAAALEKRRTAALLPPDDTNETLLS
jgi:hypothetical protein